MTDQAYKNDLRYILTEKTPENLRAAAAELRKISASLLVVSGWSQKRLDEIKRIEALAENLETITDALLWREQNGY